MYVCMSVYVCMCVCVFLCVYVQCAVRTYNLPLDLNLTTQCSNCPGWPAVCVKRLHNLAEPCRVVELSLYRRKKTQFHVEWGAAPPVGPFRTSGHATSSTLGWDERRNILTRQFQHFGQQQQQNYSYTPMCQHLWKKSIPVLLPIKYRATLAPCFSEYTGLS